MGQNEKLNQWNVTRIHVYWSQKSQCDWSEHSQWTLNFEQLADSKEVAVKQEEIYILKGNRDEPWTDEPVKIKLHMQDELCLDSVKVSKVT